MGKDGSMESLAARPTSRTGWLLFCILLLALWLRLWQFSWGLPFNYQVSEQMYMYAAQLVEKFGFGQIHPLFGVFQEVLLGERHVLKLLLPALDKTSLSPEMQTTLHSFTMSFHLLGRLTNAILGALTVLLVYGTGKRAANYRVGLVAALFWAVCFMSVRNSHYSKPDSLACFLVVLVAFLCLRLPAERPAGRAIGLYALVGAVAGLAVSAKLLTWPLFLLVPLFHFWNRERPAEGDAPAAGAPGGIPLWSHLAKLAVAGIGAVAGFVLGCPQLALDWHGFFAFWKWVGDQGKEGGMARLKIHFDHPLWSVYLHALQWGMGTFLLVLCGLGVIGLLIRRGPRPLVLLLAYPLFAYSFLLLPGNMGHDRYVMPGMPFLFLAGAWLVDTWVGSLSLSNRTRGLVTAVVLVAAVASPLYSSILHDDILGRKDTRTLAKEWIEENVPEGATLALEPLWFGPQLTTTQVWAPFSKRFYEATYSGAYGLSEKSRGPGPSQGMWTVEDYIGRGIEYLVVDGYTARLPLVDPQQDRVKSAFYVELAKRAQLVAEFSPWKPGKSVPFFFDQVYGPVVHLSAIAHPGPDLKIYRLPLPAAVPGAPAAP